MPDTYSLKTLDDVCNDTRDRLKNHQGAHLDESLRKLGDYLTKPLESPTADSNRLAITRERPLPWKSGRHWFTSSSGPSATHLFSHRKTRILRMIGTLTETALTHEGGVS